MVCVPGATPVKFTVGHVIVVVPSSVYELPVPSGAVTVTVPVPTAQVGCADTVAVGLAASGLIVTVPEPLRSAATAVQFASLNALIAYVNTCADELLGETVNVN